MKKLHQLLLIFWKRLRMIHAQLVSTFLYFVKTHVHDTSCTLCVVRCVYLCVCALCACCVRCLCTLFVFCVRMCVCVCCVCVRACLSVFVCVSVSKMSIFWGVSEDTTTSKKRFHSDDLIVSFLNGIMSNNPIQLAKKCYLRWYY